MGMPPRDGMTARVPRTQIITMTPMAAEVEVVTAAATTRRISAPHIQTSSMNISIAEQLHHLML